MAKYIRIHEGAGIDRLHLDDLPMPEPDNDEVRIRVEAFSLNYGDFGLMEGDYPFTVELPSTFGDEACGVVDAIGPRAKTFKVGDRVGTLPWMNDGYGVNGEFAIVPEYYVAPCPEKLSANEGASIWVQYMTAYYGMYTAANIHPGDVLLNCAASSSAGIAATQLAKLAGATVIGTTRGNDNIEDYVISTSTDDVSARILDITGGRGVRVVYDPVGGPLTQQYAAGLGHKAIVLLYGSMSEQDTVVPINEMIQKSAIMQPHSVYSYINDPELKAEAIKFISDALNDGRLATCVDRSFPLADFRAAYEYQWAAKNRRGKILINP
jgi:NADPH:quinone reductase-like Zn-dependent oxidoreductase